MKIVTGLLGLLLLIVVGCSHVQKVDTPEMYIPNEDVYFMGCVSEQMCFPFFMPKGFLNEENRGTLWWGSKDFEKQEQEQEQEYKSVIGE